MLLFKNLIFNVISIFLTFYYLFIKILLKLTIKLTELQVIIVLYSIIKTFSIDISLILLEFYL